MEGLVEFAEEMRKCSACKDGHDLSSFPSLGMWMASKLWKVLCNLSIEHMAGRSVGCPGHHSQSFWDRWAFRDRNWILNSVPVNILNVLRSAVFWLNHVQICAYWGTWEPSAGRTWLHKPSSSPASTKQSDESQALWHTEAADGDSCSRREMWPCSVLAAIWRHRNQIQLACVKTPPPFCMVWSCKLHLFSKGKMY